MEVPIPAEREEDELDQELTQMATELCAKCDAHVSGYQFSNALAEIWKLIARTNKYIDETMPWVILVKMKVNAPDLQQ